MAFNFGNADRSLPSFTNNMAPGVFEIAGACYLDDPGMKVDTPASQPMFTVHPNTQFHQPVNPFSTPLAQPASSSIFNWGSPQTPISTNNSFTSFSSTPSLFSVTTSSFGFNHNPGSPQGSSNSLFGTTSSSFQFNAMPSFTAFNPPPAAPAANLAGVNPFVELLDHMPSINRLLASDISIQEAIGKGHFGEVHRGVLRNGVQIAIKRIVRHSFRNKNEMTLLAQEIQIHSQLHHPNIICLIGITKIGDDYCMLTEFLPGGTLRNLIDKFPHILDPKKKHYLCRSIAAGMQYLHNWKPTPILHRDLTSANVMLDANINPKIGDFGLSRLKPDNNSTSNMTAAVGALAWMAPEVYKGEPYNEKADVYSFAIVCWELWTLSDPHCGSAPDVVASMAALKNMRPPLLDSIPLPWKDMIGSSWAPSPYNRPSFNQILFFLDSL